MNYIEFDLPAEAIRGNLNHPNSRKLFTAGTKGYLPQPGVWEYEGWGEGEGIFDAFKEPSVTLNTQGQWECEDGSVLDADGKVFATWQEAVRYTIQSTIEDEEAIIAEAKSNIAQAELVREWLEGAS